MHKRLGEMDRNLTKEGIRKEKKDTQGGWGKRPEERAREAGKEDENITRD